jgi:uncharacterized protein YjbI with pentapeptide repeats
VATRRLGNREHRTRLGARLGVLAAVAFWTIVLGPGLARAAEEGDRIPADQIVKTVAAGEPVELDGAVIVGDLDMHLIERVPRTFTCTRCTFSGSIDASNVIFERMLDLSGSAVAGRMDFGGAIFEDAFLMGASGAQPTRVAGPVTFSLANFGGRAMFDLAEFTDGVDFRVAQFGGDSSYTGTSIAGDALFDSTTFEGRAQFNGVRATTAIFGGVASFTNSTFKEKADFRQRDFEGPAMFDGVSFESADFTLAEFADNATFDGASINGSGVFRSTQFHGDLLLRRAVLRGPIDFQTASVDGRADFSNSSASDRFVLTGLDPGTSMRLSGMTAPGLEMDLSRVGRISGEQVQIDVLAMIEAGARARGDLDLANRAAYRRSQQQTAQLEGTQQLAEQVSENVGGYLVQPLLPVRAMIALVLAGTFVRTMQWLASVVPRRQVALLSPVPATGPTRGAAGVVSAASQEPFDPPGEGEAAPTSPGSAPGHDLLLWLGKLSAHTVRACADTLRAAIRIRPQDIPEDRRDDLAAYGVAVLAFGEWLAYKVLFALFLLGLANSNPTFKQLVEAVT